MTDKHRTIPADVRGKVETVTRERRIGKLPANGAAERCVVCGEVSAYCWDDCDKDAAEYGKQPGQVKHIGTAGSWEWECGHCRTMHCQADAPILAECYTHQAPELVTA